MTVALMQFCIKIQSCISATTTSRSSPPRPSSRVFVCGHRAGAAPPVCDGPPSTGDEPPSRPTRPVRRASQRGPATSGGGQGCARPAVRRDGTSSPAAARSAARAVTTLSPSAWRAPPRRRPGLDTRTRLEHRQRRDADESDVIRSAHLRRPAARAPPLAARRSRHQPSGRGAHDVGDVDDEHDGRPRRKLHHTSIPLRRAARARGRRPFVLVSSGSSGNRFGSDSVCAVHLKEPAGDEPGSGKAPRDGRGRADRVRSGAPPILRKCRSPAGSEVSQQRGKGALA